MYTQTGLGTGFPNIFFGHAPIAAQSSGGSRPARIAARNEFWSIIMSQSDAANLDAAMNALSLNEAAANEERVAADQSHVDLMPPPHPWRLPATPVSAPASACWPSAFWAPPPMARGYNNFSEMSRESSRDDLASLGEGVFFEFDERFRVDRRKLELLIMGRFEPIKENANDFFHRIGEETCTTVLWPSRLKIGSRSKRDPHLRVGGVSEESVLCARNRILEYLDIRSNRVTMKIDVSYTDHSHIIGKGGNTIRRVMSETNCHIHFPDSNRSNPIEKSNQVSIAGELSGVEQARARVRELSPLVFHFDLPILSHLQQSINASCRVDVANQDPFLKAIQDQYNIQVTFRQKQKNFHNTVVVIKGCEWEAARVKEATLLLMEHFCSGDYGDFTVFMTMDISPQHHPMVVGRANSTLRLIMQRTKTTILFPDASDPNLPPIRKGSVTISGAIHNVYLARQQLIGCLPLVMMFDLPDEIDVEDTAIQKLQEDLDVLISIKPKTRLGSKSVVLKSQERNATNIYKARAMLLGRQDEPVHAIIPESYNLRASSAISSMPMHQQRTYSLSGLNPYGFPSDFRNNNYLASSAPLGPPPLLDDFATRQQHVNALNHVLPSNQPNQSFFSNNNNLWTGGLCPPPPTPTMQPNHPLLQDYAMMVLNNITHMKQQQQLETDPARGGQDAMMRHSLSDANLNTSGVVGQKRESFGLGKSTPTANALDLQSAERVLRRPPHLHLSSALANHDLSPPIPGRSPRNSSPTHDKGNLSNNFGNESIALTCNEDDLGMCGDRRAPGFEMQNDEKAEGKESKSNFEVNGKEEEDYHKKKLLATKAVFNNPPLGEVRTPTSTWSGFGFSCSFPETDLGRSTSDNARMESQPQTIKEESADSAFHDQNSIWFNNASAMEALLEASASRPCLGDNKSAFSLDLPKDGEEVFEFQQPNAHEDLPSLFAKHGLSKYTDLFLRHELDLAIFSTLTDADLREIGVNTFGARKKLLMLAKKAATQPSCKW